MITAIIETRDDEVPLPHALAALVPAATEGVVREVIIIDHGRIFFDGPLSAIIDRFATHKILSLRFGSARGCDFAHFGEVLEQTPESVRLRIPRAKVTETTREALSACDVSDISVEEPPVEEVIRELFAAEHAAGGEELKSEK